MRPARYTRLIPSGVEWALVDEKINLCLVSGTEPPDLQLANQVAGLSLRALKDKGFTRDKTPGTTDR